MTNMNGTAAVDPSLADCRFRAGGVRRMEARTVTVRLSIGRGAPLGIARWRRRSTLRRDWGLLREQAGRLVRGDAPGLMWRENRLETGVTA